MNFKNGHYSDYKYKSDLLTNRPDLIKLQKQVSRAMFTQSDITDHRTGEVMTLQDARFYDMVYCNDSDWIEARKINHCSYQRAKRLRNRIRWMVNEGPCIFLTLTFSDDTLKSTSEETRKKYVKRFLKSQCARYVANVDYGAEKGREHYHAVVRADSVDYSQWHQLGGIKGERIRTDDLSFVRLGKYISKLTNHAIKETTKRCAIIYSSDFR